MEEIRNNSIKPYVLMHLVLLLFSVSGILSKLAANSYWFSVRWFCLYGSVLLILAIYAFFWQQILKHIPLTIAFCNKAVTILWSMAWGHVVFEEQITWNKVFGGMIVFIGICVVVFDDKERMRSRNG